MEFTNVSEQYLYVEMYSSIECIEKSEGFIFNLMKVQTVDLNGCNLVLWTNVLPTVSNVLGVHIDQGDVASTQSKKLQRVATTAAREISAARKVHINTLKCWLDESTPVMFHV